MFAFQRAGRGRVWWIGGRRQVGQQVLHSYAIERERTTKFTEVSSRRRFPRKFIGRHTVKFIGGPGASEIVTGPPLNVGSAVLSLSLSCPLRQVSCFIIFLESVQGRGTRHGRLAVARTCASRAAARNTPTERQHSWSTRTEFEVCPHLPPPLAHEILLNSCGRVLRDEKQVQQENFRW